MAGRGAVERLVRVLRPLAVGLMDELVDVTVFCPGDADLEDLPSPPVEIAPYAAPGWFGVRAAGVEQLARVAAGRRVGLLHALDAAAAGLCRRLAETADLPYVVSCYGLDDARRLRGLGPRAAAVLAASEAVRYRLLEEQVLVPRRVHLVRPGVYQVEQPTCFTDPQLSITIVADGPMNELAPWQAVLEALAAVRAGRDCVLFAMGEGKAQRRVRHAAARLGISRELTFAPRQSPMQLAGILKAADVYISPVAQPSVDLHSLLAMAAGTPVIAAAGGCSDFLVADQTALLFAQSNGLELSQRLASLLDAPSRAHDIAAGALAALRARYTAAGMTAAVAELYRRVAEPSPQRVSG